MVKSAISDDRKEYFIKKSQLQKRQKETKDKKLFIGRFKNQEHSIKLEDHQT